jgi:hypothetical protein
MMPNIMILEILSNKILWLNVKNGGLRKKIQDSISIYESQFLIGKDKLFLQIQNKTIIVGFILSDSQLPYDYFIKSL